MRSPLAFLLLGLGTTAPLAAVYAPIPELEKGKPLTAYLSAGVYHDTNIFGGSADEIDSLVYSVNPGLVFNASLSDRTFASAAYRLSYEHVADRPGDKSLDSHEFNARFAHTFTPQTELDLSETYQIAKNPESLLPGLATVVNTDQSHRRNQTDLRFATSLTRRTGLTLKARATRYDYEAAALSLALDRDEYLLGLAATHTLLPTLQSVAEYRHQLIRYADSGDTKDKTSHYLLAGADYNLTSRSALSTRLGLERRRRLGDTTETLPYAELGAKHDHGKGSYLSVGYSYSVEETSNVETYTDIVVHRFFANLQQSLTAKFTATATLTWEPSVLHGRTGVSPDRDETNTQLGLALTCRLTPAATLSLTHDRDRVRSDDPGRQLTRTRTGISARFAF